MSHMGSRFAISMLINDKHSMASRGRQRVFEQHTEPLLLDLSFIPVRFAEQPLQKLGVPMLSSHHWLGVGEPSERLVAFCWQEQTFKIPTKSFSLIPLLKEAVKWPDILFKWLWSCCCFFSFTHELFPPFSLSLILSPVSTNYR